LVGRGEFSFYVSFLFDHPIIENNDALSYLEKERSLVGSHSQDDSDFLRYLRVKLKKYIYII
ncbi:LPS biosynthesis glycosyltransferase, partial [Acinetobacter baumannii]